MNIEANTSLGIIDYITVVTAIATEYFSEDGEYRPHIGRLNAMRIFYNECVTDSRYDLSHDITDILEMETLVADKDFVEAFDYCIGCDFDSKLSFANAYADALEIVEDRKTSIGRIIDVIKAAITKLADSLAPVFSEENIQKVEKIAEDIASGKISNQSIADAVGDSDIMKMIADII